MEQLKTLEFEYEDGASIGKNSFSRTSKPLHTFLIGRIALVSNDRMGLVDPGPLQVEQEVAIDRSSDDPKTLLVVDLEVWNVV